MKRRAFIASLTGGLLAAPLAAKTQPAGTVARPLRVGVLMLPSEVVARTRVEAFPQGLRDVGYVEGDTIVIDIRYIDGHYERIPALLADLFRLDVSVIVAHGTPPSLAAKRATDSIPIVTFEISDPVGIGLVPSLAKPGGNLTGVAQLVATEQPQDRQGARAHDPAVAAAAGGSGHRVSIKSDQSERARRRAVTRACVALAAPRKAPATKTVRDSL